LTLPSGKVILIMIGVIVQFSVSTRKGKILFRIFATLIAIIYTE